MILFCEWEWFCVCNIQSRKQVEFDLQRVLHIDPRFLNGKDKFTTPNLTQKIGKKHSDELQKLHTLFKFNNWSMQLPADNFECGHSKLKTFNFLLLTWSIWNQINIYEFEVRAVLIMLAISLFQVEWECVTPCCISVFIFPVVIGLFQKKSTPPWQKACWKISQGGGINGSGNQDGRGALNLKLHSRGYNFWFHLCFNHFTRSINKFSKNCFVFPNFIILSNYVRPLTTFILSFHP